MNENIAAGALAQLARAFDVRLVGITDADRQVEIAVRIAPVDIIQPLRRPAVPLDGLVAGWFEAKTDPV